MFRYFVITSALFASLGWHSECYAQTKLAQAGDAKTYTGSIARLLDMAGEDSNVSGHWKNFEDVSGTPAEEVYQSTTEWKMQKENSKPLEKKQFNSTLEDVAEHLQDIKPTNARRQREHAADHF
jgi:hypothetical protein